MELEICNSNPARIVFCLELLWPPENSGSMWTLGLLFYFWEKWFFEKGILTGITLNLQMAFGNMVTVLILNFPIYEHWFSFSNAFICSFEDLKYLLKRYFCFLDILFSLRLFRIRKCLLFAVCCLLGCRKAKDSC